MEPPFASLRWIVQQFHPGKWVLRAGIPAFGIIDVSRNFEEWPGTLFLFTVQAHNLRGSVISASGLAEGGQLLFLSKDPDPAATDHDRDGLSPLMEDILGTSDEDATSGPNQLRIGRDSEGALIVRLTHHPLEDGSILHLEF